MDDWAFRQGKRYGTILVDLEQHRVVDLLPERSTKAFTAWLESHPGIEVVTRDRASEYSRAINQAAPKAEQVADRFYLLQNLRAEGVSNASKLYRELLNQGYTGSVGPMIWFLGFLRSGEPLEQTRSETRPPKSKLGLPHTVREITHVLVTPESRLNEKKQEFLQGLLEKNVELHGGYKLIQEFRGLFLKPD